MRHVKTSGDYTELRTQNKFIRVLIEMLMPGIFKSIRAPLLTVVLTRGEQSRGQIASAVG